MQSVHFCDVHFYANLLTLFLLQVVECNKMTKKLIKIQNTRDHVAGTYTPGHVKGPEAKRHVTGTESQYPQTQYNVASRCLHIILSTT